MQLTTLLLTALVGTALAAPSADLETRATSNMMATGKTWTITNFKRACGPAGKQCTFTYGIKPNDGYPVTQCTCKSTGNPASHASYSDERCGAFTVDPTWSNQFGNDKVFTTLSVVKGNRIIYPSYTDAQLAKNAVVKPDQSYTPANLPA